MGKEYRDLKYDVFSVRLSEDIVNELKKRRQNFKSWNLLFKELLYGKKRMDKLGD